jgi:DNA-binding Xre family transcriptional regulator
MNKPLTTYERKMRDAKFKKAYEESYKELLFSELILSMMDDDDKSIRKLADEAKLSKSVIQDLRSGKQDDIKVSNLIKLAKAFGYEVILKKGDRVVTLFESKKSKKHHIMAAAG